MLKGNRKTLCSFIFLIIFCWGQESVLASDWPSWRGPNQNGVSDEIGLISTWSLDGENLIWRADFIGRSTPIVMNGRVYVVGRTGEGITRQRRVACYDAETGRLIWEDKNNVFHTTVPFTRVGWSSLAGDPETGNVYLFGVDGLFICYDQDGNILWEHSTTEQYNRFSGYGGRTCTPVVDEDLVIVNFANNSWGDHRPMKHRFFAYDKHSGELVWVSTITARNKNTNYSVPVVAVINGQRLLITGAGDGSIYAMKVRTGEQIWNFRLSKGAIQSSVVVDGDRVYACHGRENFDNESMGRVVCIDANGTGDITDTNEVWRFDALDVGYASPLIHEGRLYVVTNAGNLYALDAVTGKEYWRFNLGTIGKGSPVWADGKIYATEVNGGFHIIRPAKNEAKSLDRKRIAFDETRAAEIYGSPAVAYGRIYFTTEVGLFCLGDKNAEFKAKPSPKVELREQPPAKNAAPVHIQIVPAEIWAKVNDEVKFRVRSFDSMGRKLGEVKAVFTLGELQGTIDKNGKFTPDKKAGNQAGYVIAKVADLESRARVQIATDLPVEFDFENFEIGKNPPLWPGAGKFVVKNIDGNNVLWKPPPKRMLKRHNLYLGPPDLTDYTIQADLMSRKVKRRRPDMGIIANRYYLDLMGRKQRLQIRCWPAELRMMKQIDFKWHPDVWYTMKLRVDIKGDKAVVKGKVWPRDEKEPEAWTITAEDPIPNLHGSPGLYGDAVTNIYYDNVKIARSE
ncbi:MAG: PQQ-binding-like beta-propeller repeat protein [bacterium]